MKQCRSCNLNKSSFESTTTMASSAFSPVTHVIFDMDGLLLDTEKLYTEAIQNVSSKFGKDYNWNLKVKCMGMKGEVSAKLIINELQLPITVPQFLELVSKEFEVLFPATTLLPDTESLYTLATERVAALFGKSYPWEVKVAQMGQKREICAKIITECLNLSLTIEEYLCAVKQHHSELFPTAKLLPGAEKLVRHLHSHKVPIAIATGGAKDSFDLKTTNHKEFISLFNHVVFASTDPDVKEGKPSPEVFVVCARRFPANPEPAKCLVFEDAPNGLEAGVAAHMQVVMVPDPRLHKDLTKGASQVLGSLEEFKPELFGLPQFES